MPYRISRLGTVEIRSLDLDRDLDYYLSDGSGLSSDQVGDGPDRTLTATNRYRRPSAQHVGSSSSRLVGPGRRPLTSWSTSPTEASR
jgi:hypothetical protein